MNLALRALLEGVVDYAGLFPPARLPLAEAARNYAKHRRSDDAWMLGRFVAPALQLRDFAAVVSRAPGEHVSWPLIALGPRCDTMVEWNTAIIDHFRRCDEFGDRHGELATISVMEFVLPAELASLPARANDIGRLIDVLLMQIDGARTNVANVFLEAPPCPAASAIRQEIVNEIGNRRRGATSLGLKIRTGGLTAAAFPSTEELAEVIRLCENGAVAWKATAGLHDPLPQEFEEMGAWKHGFLNVLVATALAHSAGLDLATIGEILLERSASQFSFTNEGLSWRGCRATVAQVQASRGRFTSFGSCSFDEPRDGLASLDLGLEEAAKSI
jgi:hypothetical protein